MFPNLKDARFSSERGCRLFVQVPEPQAQRVVAAVLRKDELPYGDYDAVTFRTLPGFQRFRSLGTGRNVATERVVEVPCVEISFFLPTDDTKAVRVIRAIYDAHPYEEPVVFIEPCIRTLHVQGLDEDNPNRFWNQPPDDWVPEEHR